MSAGEHAFTLRLCKLLIVWIDKNSRLKSPTELEKVGPTFSSLSSLARASSGGDKLAPLTFPNCM